MKTLLPLIAAITLLLPAAAQSTDAEALAFLKANAPEIYADITAFKDSEPVDYRSALDDAQKAAADYSKLTAAGDTKTAAASLKMYEMDYDAIAIADQIVSSKDTAETERLKKQLRGLIDASFEQWAIVEQARVERLEKELAALKSEVTDAITNRAKVVDEDTTKLIEESRTFQNSKTKQK